MSGAERPRPTKDMPFLSDMDEVLPVAADTSKDIAIPPTQAYATTPAIRLWRGVAIAAGLHLAAVGAALVLLKWHMPLPPPAGPVISVVVETMPQGNTTQAVTQPQMAPPHPVQPVTPMRQVQPPLPMMPSTSKPEALPLPVPPAPPPPPAPAQKIAQPPALVRGIKAPEHKVGTELVAANRPAQADASNAVPAYSVLERQLGEQGRVNLKVLVLPSGQPGRVTIVTSSGYRRLDNTARDALLTWHFQPALKNGVPVASIISYTSPG